jgi:hypothetical protein
VHSDCWIKYYQATNNLNCVICRTHLTTKEIVIDLTHEYENEYEYEYENENRHIVITGYNDSDTSSELTQISEDTIDQIINTYTMDLPLENDYFYNLSANCLDENCLDASNDYVNYELFVESEDTEF